METLKDKKKVIGVKQVMKAIDKNTVTKVYIADDADERIVRPLKELCAEKSVAVEAVPTVQQLGQACAIEVGAAAVAELH